MKNFETATSIQDFEMMAANSKNMCDGEMVVINAAKFAGETSSEWKRNFCAKHLNRFAFTRIYKVCMGEIAAGRQYYYTGSPF